MNISRQQAAIVDRMGKGGISNIEAMSELKICDFRKRVSELRAIGYDIVDMWEPHEGGRHKRYFLRREINGGAENIQA